MWFNRCETPVTVIYPVYAKKRRPLMMSGVEDVSRDAVRVSRVLKYYGLGKKKVIALNEISMTVPLGSIYGLLGPSGCGKTTLLRCVVGRLKIDGGKISTLQKPPGTVGHHVPGKLVGYMPQELALYKEFTIEETLHYFGCLNGMAWKAIKSRTSFLVQFLNLPEKKRLIEEISGGQQRRTSFAVALLHEPKILILDEPTVGVDPVLRLRIWNHLVALSSSNRTTVIITTHYIEEARQAHVVGLMRNGRLMTEMTPEGLLAKYNKLSLEEVFLHLCESDSENDDESCDEFEASAAFDSLTSQNSLSVRQINRLIGFDECPDPLLFQNQELQYEMQQLEHLPELSACQKVRWFLPRFSNIFAQFLKNITILKRQIGTMLFEFFLPGLIITLFCLCVGGDPHDLRMAVVNNESCLTTTNKGLCGSSLFLGILNPQVIVQENYNFRFDDAMEVVKAGHTWGIIEIGENFTLNLLRRYSGAHSNNATVEGSRVHLYLDLANLEISLTLQGEFFRAVQIFLEAVLERNHLDPSLAELPVKLEKAVFGNTKRSFVDFLAPGMITLVTFFLSAGLTAMLLVVERKLGLMDRSFVSGIRIVEIMAGQVATEFLVVLIQTAILLTMTLFVFGITCRGSLILVVVLTLMQGFVGMIFGFLVSSLCDLEHAVVQLTLGSFFPMILLSGFIWPLEGMPNWLQYCSLSLPLTYPIESLRSIMFRGWGLSYFQVWCGFLVSISWSCIFLILTAIVFAIRRY